MSKKNNPELIDHHVKIKIPAYIIRQIEAYLQTPVAKDLGLTNVESVILFILQDWWDRLRHVQGNYGKIK